MAAIDEFNEAAVASEEEFRFKVPDMPPPAKVESDPIFYKFY